MPRAYLFQTMILLALWCLLPAGTTAAQTWFSPGYGSSESSCSDGSCGLPPYPPESAMDPRMLTLMDQRGRLLAEMQFLLGQPRLDRERIRDLHGQVQEVTQQFEERLLLWRLENRALNGAGPLFFSPWYEKPSGGCCEQGLLASPLGAAFGPGSWTSGTGGAAGQGRLLDPHVPEDAARIQTLLFELGYYTMAVDGVWGKGSRDALQAFQKDHGMTPDGEWNRTTQNQLLH